MNPSTYWTSLFNAIYTFLTNMYNKVYIPLVNTILDNPILLIGIGFIILSYVVTYIRSMYL